MYDAKNLDEKHTILVYNHKQYINITLPRLVVNYLFNGADSSSDINEWVIATLEDEHADFRKFVKDKTGTDLDKLFEDDDD